MTQLNTICLLENLSKCFLQIAKTRIILYENNFFAKNITDGIKFIESLQFLTEKYARCLITMFLIAFIVTKITMFSHQ